MSRPSEGQSLEKAGIANVAARYKPIRASKPPLHQLPDFMLSDGSTLDYSEAVEHPHEISIIHTISTQEKMSRGTLWDYLNAKRAGSITWHWHWCFPMHNRLRGRLAGLQCLLGASNSVVLSLLQASTPPISQPKALPTLATWISTPSAYSC